jgi:TonB family protein
MGYQALLFCPDEKTARTVTQVLSELEFAVEPCTEPFAAVKKLMGEHFDAIVVDCENEQNATLLLKSAHNSTSNQTSLAVAVVEGQAGVAKAFRIGANLVLTKPINVEQAKGTLRVARGLLRKGDPAKAIAPAAPSPIPAATPAVPARTAPQTRAPGSVTPHSDAPTQPARPFTSLFAAPTAAAPTMAASSAPPANDDDDVIDVDEPAVATNPNRNPAVASSIFKPGSAFSKLEAPSVPTVSSAAIKSAKDTVPPSSRVSSASASGAGTGSAAAPARWPQKLGEGTPPNIVGPAEALFEKPADFGKVESSAPLAAPSFSFGGVTPDEEPSGGGSKKVLIGVAAAALVAVGLYVGWTQFHGKTSSPEESPRLSATSPATTVTLPAKTAAPKVPPANESSKPAPEVTSPSPSSTSQPTSQPTPHKLTEMPVAESNQRSSDKTQATKGSARASGAIAAPTAKSSSDVKSAVQQSAAQPIVVKNGTSSPARESSATSDAAAPSVVGIAPSTSGGSLSNLLGNPSDTKPVLQTLNVSQGVSQGLLIKKVQPAYPSSAIRMHVEGAVQLLATIGKTGNITAVKILSGEPLLAQSALDAVKQWKYKPYYLNGEPVEIQTQVTVNFKLPR